MSRLRAQLDAGNLRAMRMGEAARAAQAKRDLETALGQLRAMGLVICATDAALRLADDATALQLARAIMRREIMMQVTEQSEQGITISLRHPNQTTQTLKLFADGKAELT